MQTRGEHANSTQKGVGQGSNPKLGPSYWAAAVLPTVQDITHTFNEKMFFICSFKQKAASQLHSALSPDHFKRAVIIGKG